MAKKRKTLQEKIKADLRHHTITPLVVEYSLPSSKNSTSYAEAVPHLNLTSLSDTRYVKHDLIKTSTITGVIILVELLTFLTLR
ncbi:MAG: hypothetical protein HZC02_04085 [Candidatus Levybacteria bacterium]|nr:hypothetical protein [Candidatus Levybacteria bacterium]